MPSEARRQVPSRSADWVVRVVADGVGVGLAIDQRTARVRDAQHVPEGGSAISAHQWPSVTIRSNQWSSEVISGHQWSSVAISVRGVEVSLLDLLTEEDGA